MGNPESENEQGLERAQQRILSPSALTSFHAHLHAGDTVANTVPNFIKYKITQ